MEERERRFATLDASIENRMTALRAGRSKPAAEIFDRLEAKYTKMAEERGL
jgi:antitoxin ParD1/3/4